MKGKRTVITGIGVVAPTGIGKENFLKTLKKTATAIKDIKRIDVSSLACKKAGEITNFDPSKYLSKKEIRRKSRSSKFGIAAAIMAHEDSKLNLNNIDANRIGVLEGTSLGGLECVLRQYDNYLRRGEKGISPFVMSNGFIGAGSGDISIELQLKGPSFTISTGSASSADAIGLAANAIKNGELDIAFAGGTEAPILPQIIATFLRSKLLPETAKGEKNGTFRPFDKNRTSFLLGEGAGYLILEELEHAKARKAKIYAEIAGYGKNCDAHHITSHDPQGSGIVAATKKALKEANLTPPDIDYINAHGTGTVINDKVETLAIKKAFGKDAYNIPISSTKPLTGHLLGACGVIEVIICILSMNHGIVPPTLNYKTADPLCNLNYVPNQIQYKPINTCLNYAFGFGGKNTALIIKNLN